jgi:hypothetical protein
MSFGPKNAIEVGYSSPCATVSTLSFGSETLGSEMALLKLLSPLKVTNINCIKSTARKLLE